MTHLKFLCHDNRSVDESSREPTPVGPGRRDVGANAFNFISPLRGTGSKATQGLLSYLLGSMP